MSRRRRWRPRTDRERAIAVLWAIFLGGTVCFVAIDLWTGLLDLGPADFLLYALVAGLLVWATRSVSDRPEASGND